MKSTAVNCAIGSVSSVSQQHCTTFWAISSTGRPVSCGRARIVVCRAFKVHSFLFSHCASHKKQSGHQGINTGAALQPRMVLQLVGRESLLNNGLPSTYSQLVIIRCRIKKHEYIGSTKRDRTEGTLSSQWCLIYPSSCISCVNIFSLLFFI